MVADMATGTGTTFAEATAVKQVDSHTYSAFFPDDWCIGSVPHGGFVTSVFLHTAKTHFRTTLSAHHQPHALNLHLAFLRRTQVGPARLVVKDVKLGRQTSVIHVTLLQDGREEVVAYVTHADLRAERGLSLDTGWALSPKELPVVVEKLREDGDEQWGLWRGAMPFPGFRKAVGKVRFWFPRAGQRERSWADEWIAFSTGERFTNESLGYVSDMWPSIVEAYRPSPPHPLVPSSAGPPSPDLGREGAYWYPTLVLNLDIKKPLPDEGVEFLFARVRAKTVRNGRLDLEVVVKDHEGDVVALSHQVVLVLSAARNLAERRTGKL